MLRMEDDYVGEAEEVSDSEGLSDEDYPEDVSLVRPRSPSKRKGDRRSSPPPQKKSKVAFASIEYREHID